MNVPSATSSVGSVVTIIAGSETLGQGNETEINRAITGNRIYYRLVSLCKFKQIDENVQYCCYIFKKSATIGGAPEM